MQHHAESLFQPAFHLVSEHKPATLFMVANKNIYVDGLVRILDDQHDIHVVACASPAPDCYSLYAESQAGVLMVDASVIPGQQKESAPSLLFDTFRKLCPDLRIIVFGHAMSDEFIQRMIHAGVHGFIDSRITPTLLGAAIHKVSSGGFWISRRSLEQIAVSVSERERMLDKEASGNFDHMREALTASESDVLQGVLEGKPTRQIAENLGLSEQCIKMRLGKLFKIFGVSNRRELILLAIKNVCPVNAIIELLKKRA